METELCPIKCTYRVLSICLSFSCSFFTSFPLCLLLSVDYFAVILFRVRTMQSANRNPRENGQISNSSPDPFFSQMSLETKLTVTSPADPTKRRSLVLVSCSNISLASAWSRFGRGRTAIFFKQDSDAFKISIPLEK